MVAQRRSLLSLAWMAVAVLIAGVAAIAIACSSDGSNTAGEDAGTKTPPVGGGQSVAVTESPATREARNAQSAVLATVFALRPSDLPVVATVDGTPIAGDLLFLSLATARLSGAPDEPGLSQPTPTARDFVRSQVQDALMQEEAQRRGLDSRCTEARASTTAIAIATISAERDSEGMRLLAEMQGQSIDDWVSDPRTIEGYRRGCMIAALRTAVQSEAGQAVEVLTPGVFTTETQAIRDLKQQLEAQADITIDDAAIAEVERAVEEALR